MSSPKLFERIRIFFVAGSLVCLPVGCEKPKEKVLDIEAPGVSVEVERSRDEAEVDIDTPPASRDGKVEVETNP